VLTSQPSLRAADSDVAAGFPPVQLLAVPPV